MVTTRVLAFVATSLLMMSNEFEPAAALTQGPLDVVLVAASMDQEKAASYAVTGLPFDQCHFFVLNVSV